MATRHKPTPPPTNKIVGDLTDFYDKEGVYYKDKTDGQLYVGAKNQADKIVTIVARVEFNGARRETITILKNPKKYAI